MSLGPGITCGHMSSCAASAHHHCLAAGHVVRRATILGGLHREYWLEKVAREPLMDFLRSTRTRLRYS